MLDWVTLPDLTAWSEGLLAPSQLLFNPSSRLFWGFCLSSVLLAALVLWLQHRRLRAHKSFWHYACAVALAPKHWFNRSSMVDLTCLLGNSLLRVAVIVPLLGSHLAFALVVARTLQSNFGNGPDWALPWAAIAAIYTLVFFVVEDFSRFLLHYSMHKSRFLWRFHRLHHSATSLTPLTLFRAHPIEMALYYSRGLLVFGVLSGIFIYLFGGRLSGLQILGVDALGFAFNALGANLRHSPVWLSFGKWERWFISPAQHQVHHSAAVQHRDRNFGTCLAVWDRLLGSHVRTDFNPQPLQFGLAAGAKHAPLRAPLKPPFTGDTEVLL